MNGVAAFLYDKVVHQSATGCYGLRAHAGATRNEIALANFRYKLLQCPHKSGLAEGAIKLAESGLPIFSRHSPEAFERSGLPQISEIDLGMTVPFASKGEDRVGPSFDPAFRHPGEVNSQERKSWIWYGINQIPHQKLSFGGNLIVLAAKWNDSVLLTGASINSFHHLGNDVRVEAATIDQIVRAIVASRALQNDFLRAF